eukprot:TRINITY_DN946_c2_g1_i1.p1 TRINITY_DN946_c2_g1~~TRINITY_DN946_c2_g1_i1.p1  ORF type:complete len:338 (+),score=55.77 TRINITY_DN946_c2_g1_i1:56-1069(+)
MTSKALILVGGPRKGTRFRPLSLELPKPLFPIAGKPMIHHHIEACAQIDGLEEVVLIGFYEASLFSSFIEETQKEFKIKISYLNEENSLGTAGGLYMFKDKILAGSPSTIFILHADICCAFPLKEMLAFHKSSSKVCTIMGTKVPREYANTYGCLIKDEVTHELSHYTEKPETFISDLINAGIYCIEPSFFDIIGQVKASQKKDEFAIYEASQTETDKTGRQSLDCSMEIVKRQFLDTSIATLRLEQDVFVPLAGTKQLYVYQYDGFWRQIKNAGASVYCNDLYTKHYQKVKPSVLVAPRAGIIGNVMILFLPGIVLLACGLVLREYQIKHQISIII